MRLKSQFNRANSLVHLINPAHLSMSFPPFRSVYVYSCFSICHPWRVVIDRITYNQRQFQSSFRKRKLQQFNRCHYFITNWLIYLRKKKQQDTAEPIIIWHQVTRIKKFAAIIIPFKEIFKNILKASLSEYTFIKNRGFGIIVTCMNIVCLPKSIILL